MSLVGSLVAPSAAHAAEFPTSADASSGEQGPWSPIGQIDAVEDADVWRDDGTFGGLVISGSVQDPDRGDHFTWLAVTVDGREPEIHFGSWGEWTDFGVQIPLEPGTHAVCVTAINVGSGSDTDLGCREATVLLRAPEPQVALHQDATVTVDGLTVASSETPSFAASVVYPKARWGESVGEPSVHFSVEAEDGHLIESESQALTLVDDGAGNWIGRVVWEVTEPLNAGREYWVSARSTAVGAVDSFWNGAEASFLSYAEPAVPDLVDPVDGAVTIDTTPSLMVALAPSALPESAVFQVLDGAGFVVAEGQSEEIDGPERVSWTAPEDLVPGTYTWRALARNGVAQSAWTELARLEIGSVPDQPRVVSVTHQKRDMVVSFYLDGPLSDIQDYTVTASPGNHAVSVEPNGGRFQYATLTGLDAGTYYIRVSARNKFGSSPGSWATPVYHPAASPTAPENFTAHLTPSSGTVTLTWDPPLENFGRPVTSYLVKDWTTGVTSTVPADTFETSITGLEFGQRRSFAVAAMTAIGPGDWAETTVVPYTIPAAPGHVAGTLGDGEVDLTWEAPDFDGGAAVVGYEVSVEPGGVKTRFGAATHATVKGLSNGTAYTFTVAAINAAGQGMESLPSPELTPLPEATDTDADTLPDILESRTGSNPDLVDTDFDGLTDAEEVLQLAGLVSPTAHDSDDDGLGDAGEDADGDGLSNGEEILAGTNPASDDSDSDGLDDHDEVLRGLNPVSSDTDGDALVDGQEIALGLDAARPDTDSDGTADASQSIDQTLTTVAVQAQVNGPAARVITARLAVLDTSLVGAITDTFIVTAPTPEGTEAQGELTVSSVTLPIPSSHDPTAELTAMAWDAGTGRWIPVDNSVQVNAAEATVEVFSPTVGRHYQVVDLDEWRAQGQRCARATVDDAAIDLEIVLDDRPKMHTYDPTGEAYNAIDAVMGTLRPGDEATARYFGLIMASFGYGFSVLTDRGDLAGDVAGTSVDRVAAALSERRAAPSSGPSEAYGYPGWDEIEEEQFLAEGWAEFEIFENVADPQRSEPRSVNPFVDDNAQVAAPDCLNEAMLLVTAGEFYPEMADRPFPDHYIDTPVHVLDVGNGGQNATWLRALAEQSGGTYSHVATAELQFDRTSDVTTPPDTTTDTDGDGLTDWLETHGYSGTLAMSDLGASRHTFYSDPNSVDSDGDGLLDADEAGSPACGVATTAYPCTQYAVVSHPGDEDGDVDDVLDSEELELEMNPLDSDPDRDGLRDGYEQALGTSPSDDDTDADGFSDGYEEMHKSLGYDALEPTYAVDEELWQQQFTLGLLCGDNSVCYRPTMAWLTGNIVSGVLVFGDVRDIVAAALEDRWIDTALIAVSFIPAVGDIAGAAAKFAKALPRMAEPAAAAARRWLMDLWAYADDAGSIGPRSIDDVVGALRQAYPDVVSRLENLDIPAERIAAILNKNSPARIQKYLDLADEGKVILRFDYPTDNLKPGAYMSGRSAENWIREVVGSPIRPNTWTMPSFTYNGRTLSDAGRVHDALRVNEVGEDVLVEIKMGVGARSGRQIAMDAQRVAGGDFVEWHYVMSAWTGRIGPGNANLTKLVEAGIPVVIHFPLS